MTIIQRGEASDALLTVGRLTIDLRARQVRDTDRLLALTGKEFDLLAFLAARPGHVFDRAELLRAVWQSTPEWQQPATVTEHIRRLRAKIEIEPRQPRILRTVRGSGYRLDRPGSEASVEIASERASSEGQPEEQVTLTHVSDPSASLRRLVTGVLGEVTDAVIITDLHFHLRSWNQAAERLYGWREEEVLGRHLLDVLRPSGETADDERLAAVWQHLEDRGHWKGESRHRTRDGSLIEVRNSTSLIRDDSGEPILIVAVNRAAPVAVSAEEAAAICDDEEIRTGLADDAFVVHYQPTVDLTDDLVIGMEALVRWDHPDRGLLTPDAFIAAAERSGAIIELGDVVFEKACTQAAEWRRAGMDLMLSVNLSARQLADPALYDRIVAVLASTGLDPARLSLEVTETALIDDVDRASAMLSRLAELGISLVIDDFGTGWASLTYLRNFPIHALKIDRSFVAGVGSNVNDTAIARSILTLGAELGLAVVAEGVETRAQQHALQKLGCTLGQGFLYGRPGPASDVPPDTAGRSAPAATSSLSQLPPAAGAAPPRAA